MEAKETSQAYWSTVRAYAEEVIALSEGDEDLYHDNLHELIDGSQYIIYYYLNDAVLKHTDNEDAWEECYGAEDIGNLVIKQGMTGARTVQAFFAMAADVQNMLHAILEEREEA